MMRYTKEGNGELMVNVVGSISRLTAERHDDKTILANYGHVEATLETPEEILRATETLQKEFKDVPGHAGMYLRGMVDAFQMNARILSGEQISMKDAIAVMQQVELNPIPQEKFDRLAHEVTEGLGKRGYKGNIGEMVQTWLKDTALEPEEVTATAKRFMDRAKNATLKLVTDLPEGDGIDDVYSIRNVFWSGLSRYLGDFRGDLTFNIDRPWSLPTFGNVLCHEGYPGHQTFYCHWDHLYRQGRLPLEAAFYSTAGNPANPMFEGSPECGLHFLGWDDFNEHTPEISDEEKADFLLGRHVQDLQRIVQMQGYYKYHVEGASKEEAIELMMNTGIFSKIEAENCTKFFTHPVQQYYYPAYYYGRWMIYEAYQMIPREKRNEFFRFLYDMPHTNETFIKGIADMTGKAFAPFATC